MYGSGVKGNFFRLLKLVDEGIPLPLASVQNRRSLVSVWNLCDLTGSCVTHPAAAGETFLVSDQHDLSTPELLRELSDAFGRQARLLPFPLWGLRALGAVTRQGGTIERLTHSLQVASSKASARLGWAPPVPIRDGVRRTVDWYRRGSDGSA